MLKPAFTVRADPHVQMMLRETICQNMPLQHTSIAV